MAQFMYYPATKLFYNIPSNIDNLNHDKQEFVRHRFRSACYAQSYSVQEPAFINNWPTSVVCISIYIYIYIYIERERELLVKLEILKSYIFGTTFGNAESRPFLFAAQSFNTESKKKVTLWHSCV
jgi:hypothetical protein